MRQKRRTHIAGDCIVKRSTCVVSSPYSSSSWSMVFEEGWQSSKMAAPLRAPLAVKGLASGSKYPYLARSLAASAAFKPRIKLATPTKPGFESTMYLSYHVYRADQP